MSALCKQHLDLAAEYRCNRVDEDNTENLEAGYNSVEIDHEDNNRPKYESVVDKWNPAELDN